MSKFDKVEKGTKIIITYKGAEVLSQLKNKPLAAGQIGYFEGFAPGDGIVKVRITGRDKLGHYSDEFWRVWTRPSVSKGETQQ